MKPKPSTAFTLAALPDSMTSARRWVRWKPIERDGKWTKIPVQVNGAAASSTDPTTWSTLDEVYCAAVGKDGIGFMLGDGWLGVDFDGVSTAPGEWLDPWVKEWANEAGTYVEWSPSGTGIHAIFRDATLPSWSQNRRGGVEVYDKSRFFCVTGNALNSHDANASSVAFHTVCERYLKKDEPIARIAQPPTATATIELKDSSAEDWRLCCALAAQGWKDTRIEEQLRHKMTSEGREEKMARKDYVERTVAGAIRTAGTTAQTAQPPTFRALVDVIKDYPNQAPFLVDQLVRRGEVAAVIAPPKCMKSFLMHDLAISLATGRSWVGEFACERCRVLLVDNELQLATISERVNKIVKNMGFGLAALDGHFDVLSLREDDRDLDAVLEAIKGLEHKYDFVIFDALYMFLEAGMDENSNADMTILLRKFRRFATKVDCGVMLVHHTSKGIQSGKDSLDLGAGAGSLGRAVDMHIGIYRHEEDNTFVAHFKTRSSAPVPPVGIEWDYPRFRRAIGIDLEDLWTGPKKKKAT